VWSAPWLSRHASLIALGHQSLFTSVSFHRPLRQQSSSSSFFILLSLSLAFCVCAETKRIIFLHWLRRKGIIKKHLHYFKKKNGSLRLSTKANKAPSSPNQRNY
jgi:hypothetical protein